MPSLILEFGTTRHGLDLIDANTSVGRGGENAIVVDHPTVSRVHAWFVREDDENAGDVFLRDTNSANGTYVDGKRVSGKQPLRDGALIRIGPARMVFRSGALKDVDPNLAIGKKRKTNPDGMLFACDCGARLWVARRRAGHTGICPTCKSQLTFPIDEDLVLSDEMPAPMLAAESSDAPIALCSICQCGLADTDTQQACPACGLHFHADCWTENCGCSAYGCSQVNALASATDEAELAEDLDASPAGVDDLVFDDVPANRFPWEFALLAASVVCTLIGLLAFGVPPFIVATIAALMSLKRREDPTRKTGVVMACVGLALLGTFGGIVISSWWWFGSKPL